MGIALLLSHTYLEPVVPGPTCSPTALRSPFRGRVIAELCALGFGLGVTKWGVGGGAQRIWGPGYTWVFRERAALRWGPGGDPGPPQRSARISLLRARLLSTNLGPTRDLVFRKKGSSGCEQKGACVTPIIAHASVLHITPPLVHL